MLILAKLIKEYLLQVGGEHTNYAWMNHICLLPFCFFFVANLAFYYNFQLQSISTSYIIYYLIYVIELA
jgi:hypothetical protein